MSSSSIARRINPQWDIDALGTVTGLSPMGLYSGPRLVIRNNDKGRGVYTQYSITRGDRVHECTMLVYPRGVRPDRFMKRYVWEWRDGRRVTDAICLGMGSLFNHSPKPNVSSRRLFKSCRMIFTALRDIQDGEELLVDYGAGAELFEVVE